MYRYLLLILIMGPAMGETYGFSEDADVRILEQPAAPPSTKSAANAPQGIGIGGTFTYYYATDGNNFLGRTSDFQGGSVGVGDRHCVTGSTERYVDHEIKMTDPNSVLQWMRIWGQDNNATHNLRLIMYRSCLPKFGAASIYTEIFNIQTFLESSGTFSTRLFINESFEHMESDCKIMARIQFGSSPTCSNISDVKLFKLRAQFLSGDLIYRDNMDAF